MLVLLSPFKKIGTRSNKIGYQVMYTNSHFSYEILKRSELLENVVGLDVKGRIGRIAQQGAAQSKSSKILMNSTATAALDGSTKEEFQPPSCSVFKENQALVRQFHIAHTKYNGILYLQYIAYTIHWPYSNYRYDNQAKASKKTHKEWACFHPSFM